MDNLYSSGQSYLIGRRIPDSKLQVGSALGQDTSSTFGEGFSAAKWRALKKESEYANKDYSIAKSEIFRQDPISANQIMAAIPRLDFRNKGESKDVPVYGELVPSRYQRNHPQVLSSKFYSSPLVSQLFRRHANTFEPDQRSSMDAGKSYSRAPGFTSSFLLQRESILGQGTVPQNFNRFVSNIVLPASHSATTSRSESVSKRLSQFREMIEQAKLDDEKFKQRKKAIDEEIQKKKKQQLLYDPAESAVDYLELLKESLNHRRSKSLPIASFATK